MVNKKASIRLIQSKTVETWPCSARVCDWLDHGRAHIRILRIEIKHVNRKTCVHQISEIGLMKRVQVWSCAVASVWGCIVVDQQCRGSNGKVKIEAYTWVSDENAHHQGTPNLHFMIFRCKSSSFNLWRTCLVHCVEVSVRWGNE